MAATADASLFLPNEPGLLMDLLLGGDADVPERRVLRRQIRLW
jgi:hypothetical protein